MTVLICMVLLSAGTDPDRPDLPTVTADTVTIGEVRRGSEIGAVTEFGYSRDALLVERPVGAREGAKSSVFVVDVNGEQLRRVAVEYRSRLAIADSDRERRFTWRSDHRVEHERVGYFRAAPIEVAIEF